MKNRILSVVLVICLFFTVLTFFGCGKDKDAVPFTGITINVYNWGEYISDGSDGSMDVNAEFEKRTGIKVNYTTYENNETLYAKLSSGAADYDIIIPSDYMIGKMINEDMLAKLNFENIPNYQYIDEQFKNLEYDPNNEYSVPFTWGTVGIFYNKTMVDEADIQDAGWDILWNEKYSGEILMFDNPRDAFAIAEKKLGYSMNTTDSAEIEACAQELMKQKPLVQAYVMDQIFDKMANNEAALAPYYSGDANIMLNENPDLGYFVPKEGTNRFVDAICIPKTTQHQKEAEMYINFLLEPDVALANAEFLGYSTPHTDVMQNLDEEMANNPIYYPDETVLKKTEVFITLPDEVNRLMDEKWIELKK